MSAPAVASPPSGLDVHVETNGERWDAFVDGRSDATGYHRWAWAHVFEQALGHVTRYFTAVRHGCVVGVFPVVLFRSRLFGRFGVSLPFVNYGGVLADDHDVEEALLRRAIAEARAAGLGFLELRHTTRRFEGLTSRRHKVAMTLDLGDTVEEQWRALGKKVRNQVRKAEKCELSVRIGHRELLESFYGVFARNMRDLGTPVYSRRFFEAVLDAAGRRAQIFAVFHGERAVAASVVLTYRDRCEVPWASSIREFNHLCANMLLYWVMLRDAVEHGRRVFDFGRSTPGGSTYAFKRQWGAAPQELVWEYWLAEGRDVPDFVPSSPKYHLATALWRRLPLAVASRLGPTIVRNIP